MPIHRNHWITNSVLSTKIKT